MQQTESGNRMQNEYSECIHCDRRTLGWIGFTILFFLIAVTFLGSDIFSGGFIFLTLSGFCLVVTLIYIHRQRSGLGTAGQVPLGGATQPIPGQTQVPAYPTTQLYPASQPYPPHPYPTQPYYQPQPFHTPGACDTVLGDNMPPLPSYSEVVSGRQPIHTTPHSPQPYPPSQRVVSSAPGASRDMQSPQTQAGPSDTVLGENMPPPPSYSEAIGGQKY